MKGSGQDEKAVGIILQARMGSTRLPGKILMPLGESSLLGCIFKRLASLRHHAALVLATSKASRDDVVARFCQEQGVECFRGSEEDVLARYYQAACHYGFRHIVRLTADNPFIDVTELDRLLEVHLSDGNDYTHSFDSLPVGVGAEVFTFEALEESFRLGTKPNHREHVNEFIQEHPQFFQIATLEVPAEKNRPEVRLTVDTPLDYRRACFIQAHGPGGCLGTAQAIDLGLEFENDPEGTAVIG